MKIKQTMILTLSSLMLVTAFTATPITKVEAATKADKFVDVDKTNSHYDGIMYWSKEQVINGYPLKNNQKEYRPWERISREHTAVLFNRGLSLSIPNPEGVKEILKEVSDVSPDHPYAGQIASMYRDKIFEGSNGRFMGDHSLSREQMATVLVGAFDLKSGKNKVKVSMKRVDKSHQKNVQILSDLEVTNQVEDFRPREKVTRGQFATFLKRAEQAKYNPSVKPTPVPKPDPKPDKPKPKPDKPAPSSGKYQTTKEARVILDKTDMHEYKNSYTHVQDGRELLFVNLNKSHVTAIRFNAGLYDLNKNMSASFIKEMAKAEGMSVAAYKSQLDKEVKSMDKSVKSVADAVYGKGTKKSKVLAKSILNSKEDTFYKTFK